MELELITEESIDQYVGMSANTRFGINISSRMTRRKKKTSGGDPKSIVAQIQLGIEHTIARNNKPA